MNLKDVTTDQLVSELRKRPVAFILWNVGNVMDQELSITDNEVSLVSELITEADAEAILESLDRNSDAEYGITWNHLDSQTRDQIAGKVLPDTLEPYKPAIEDFKIDLINTIPVRLKYDGPIYYIPKKEITTNILKYAVHHHKYTPDEI